MIFLRFGRIPTVGHRRQQEQLITFYFFLAILIVRVGTRKLLFACCRKHRPIRPLCNNSFGQGIFTRLRRLFHFDRRRLHPESLHHPNSLQGPVVQV